MNTQENEKIIHQPVLIDEVLNNLRIYAGMSYLDCTVGFGGHFLAIYEKANKTGKFYGFDQDEMALNYCKNKFKTYPNIFLFNDNFSQIKEVIGNDIKFDSILIDLGVSSFQLDEQERGFSYHLNARLDMRMNQKQKLNAYEVINFYPKEKLIQIFKEYGEVKKASKVAELICETRKIQPISTTFELRELIYQAEFSKNLNRKNPAKQYFQAIRIYVNDEINILKNNLKLIASYLKQNGTLGVITFHSLEEKIVKNIFRELSTIDPIINKLPIQQNIEYTLITKKPFLPNENELNYNNRAHSAKLYIIKKN